MKLLAPPASYPLLAAPRVDRYGLPLWLPLLRYVMETGSDRSLASVPEHPPAECPYMTTEKQDAAMVPFHGADCHWAAAVRERWRTMQIDGLTQARDRLSAQLDNLKHEGA